MLFKISVCRADPAIDQQSTNQLEIGVVANPEACSAACSANADCESWVYYTETYFNPLLLKQCFLRWNVYFEFPLPAGASVSGFKGCP